MEFWGTLTPAYWELVKTTALPTKNYSVVSGYEYESVCTLPPTHAMKSNKSRLAAAWWVAKTL